MVKNDSIKREIVVTKENRQFLMRVFGVTNQTVYNALDLANPQTEIRSKIRKTALERGGEIMVTLPELETIHTADGVMVQRLANGSVLKFYREDGRGEIWYKGLLMDTRNRVTIQDIFDMQQKASMLG